MKLWLLLVASIPVWGQNLSYFPFAADGASGDGSLRTSILIENPGTVAAKVAISWTTAVTLSDLGTNSRFSLTLAAGATRILQTSGAGSGVAGAVAISADQVVSAWGVVSAFDGSGVLVGETGFAAAASSTGFRIPVDAAAGFNTGIALYNPGPGTASISANLVDVHGGTMGSKTITLAAGARVTRFVSGDLYGALEGFQGTLDLKSTLAVAAQVIRKNDESPLGAILEATPLTSKRMKFYLPRLADGPSLTGALRTTFLLTNLAAKPAKVTVTLSREDGSPWAVAIPGMDSNSTFQTTIAPGTTTFWQTDGAGAYAAGAASIRSDRPIGVQALVTATGAEGVTISETAAGDARLRQQFTLPFDTSTGGLSTGAAFYNPGMRPVSIVLTLLDADGKIAASTLLAPVAAGGHATGAVSDFFPGTTIIRGALLATTNATGIPGPSDPFVSALAVRDNQGLPWPSTLPAGLKPLTGVPMKFSTTVDDKRAVTASIGPKGGSLSLTNAGGDKFTLIIPANALLGTEKIVMTPVTAASGLPGTGLAAVQLAPDGLVLLAPATLAVQPAAPAPAQTTLMPIGWYGSTPGVYLNPLQPKASQFTMLISHFSAAGTAYFKAGDLTSVLLNIIDLKAYYESEGTAILAANRETVGIPEEYLDVFDVEWSEVIAPLIEIALASQDDNVIRCALTHALGYERQLQLLGVEKADEIQEAVFDFMATGLQIAIGHAEKRCTQDHEFTALEELLSLLRQDQLFSGGSNSGPLPDYSALEKQCPFNLRLDFTSQMKTTYTPGGLYSGQISAKVPLFGDWDKQILTQVKDPAKDLLATYTLYNSAPITYDNFSFAPTGCRVVSTKLLPGDLSVVPQFSSSPTEEKRSQVQFMFTAAYDPSPYSISGVQLCAFCPVYRKKLLKVDILLDTGLTFEDMQVACPPDGPEPIRALYWMDAWLMIHTTDDIRGYTWFPNWDLVVSPDVLAEKKSNLTGGRDRNVATENTAMKLTRISAK